MPVKSFLYFSSLNLCCLMCLFQISDKWTRCLGANSFRAVQSLVKQEVEH